jgi:hypothetical protein
MPQAVVVVLTLIKVMVQLRAELLIIRVVAAQVKLGHLLRPVELIGAAVVVVVVIQAARIRQDLAALELL